MSYLSRLGARAVKSSQPLEPRPRSRFEPLADKVQPAPLEVEELVELPGHNRTSTTDRPAPAVRPPSQPADKPAPTSPRPGNAAQGQIVDRPRRVAGESLGEHSAIQVAGREAPSAPVPPVASEPPKQHSAAVSRASVLEGEATSEDSLAEPAARLVDSDDRSPLHSRPGIEPALDLAALRQVETEPVFIEKPQAAVAGDAREVRNGLPVAEVTSSLVVGESRKEGRRAERTDSNREPAGGPERPDEPTVTVRIGRIDVRASLPAPAEGRSVRPPIETLDEYMRRTATRR